jgi:hypothetical protein
MPTRCEVVLPLWPTSAPEATTTPLFCLSRGAAARRVGPSSRSRPQMSSNRRSARQKSCGWNSSVQAPPASSGPRPETPSWARWAPGPLGAGIRERRLVHSFVERRAEVLESGAGQAGRATRNGLLIVILRVGAGFPGRYGGRAAANRVRRPARRRGGEASGASGAGRGRRAGRGGERGGRGEGGARGVRTGRGPSRSTSRARGRGTPRDRCSRARPARPRRRPR